MLPVSSVCVCWGGGVLLVTSVCVCGGVLLVTSVWGGGRAAGNKLCLFLGGHWRVASSTTCGAQLVSVLTEGSVEDGGPLVFVALVLKSVCICRGQLIWDKDSRVVEGNSRLYWDCLSSLAGT